MGFPRVCLAISWWLFLGVKWRLFSIRIHWYDYISVYLQLYYNCRWSYRAYLVFFSRCIDARWKTFSHLNIHGFWKWDFLREVRTLLFFFKDASHHGLLETQLLVFTCVSSRPWSHRELSEKCNYSLILIDLTRFSIDFVRQSIWSLLTLFTIYFTL